jgi:hypothetical protein
MNMENVGNKLMDRFFRRVDGVVWDLMSGRIGVKNNDGIVTIEGSGDDAQVVVNLFDQFGLEVPAFAQSTPVASVAVGDLIYGQKGVLGWVIDKTDKAFTLLKPDGTRSHWSPPKVQMFGLDGGVMVLRSLINMLPGGTGGLGQMQSLLMPMLMMGDGAIDLDSMMPMLLMSQIGTGDGTVAAGGNMGNMMQMMLMMQMFKKGGGTSGGNNFFDAHNNRR